MINEEMIAAMRSFIGVSEVEGEGNNETIMEMARILGVGHFVADSQEHCGLVMAMISHMCKAPIPPSFLLARSWLSVGITSPNPSPGDVVVLWTGTPDGPGGHVGLLESFTDTEVWLVGGNQVNAIRSFKYDRARIIGIRRVWRV